ncbi:hypothetical protein BB560_006065, partial [Smittium megazygosporum]
WGQKLVSTRALLKCLILQPDLDQKCYQTTKSRTEKKTKNFLMENITTARMLGVN